MPAYNAEKTLAQTYSELPHDIVDDVILVDDASADGTVPEAQEIGIKHVVRHPKNKGYGGNQKSCYAKALSLGADVVIMVHPDYQYTPKPITAMTSLIAEGLFDCVLGSRILGRAPFREACPYINTYPIACFHSFKILLPDISYRNIIRGTGRIREICFYRSTG